MRRCSHPSAWGVLVTVVLWILCPGLAQGEPSAKGAHESVSLVLQWKHQSQFAGYYMALEKGFYRDAGLDVKLVQGGPDVQPEVLLAQGKADFCSVMLPTALELRDAGLPMVLLAQVVNRSNFLLVAWKQPEDGKASPITQPADLTGRQITVWEQGFRTPYLSFFEGWGSRPKILPQYYTLSLFLHRGAVACSAMRYNEYHTLLQSGVSPDELIVFNLWDMGVNMPEDGLYCLAETWRLRPEVCRKIAKASLEGWRYARDHREETLKVVMRYVREENLPTNKPHMAWMLNEILKSVFPAEGDAWTFGMLGRQAYLETAELLQRQRRIDASVDYRNFVKLEAMYETP